MYLCINTELCGNYAFYGKSRKVCFANLKFDLNCKIWSSGSVVVKLLASGARDPGLDSRSGRYNFRDCSPRFSAPIIPTFYIGGLWVNPQTANIKSGYRGRESRTRRLVISCFQVAIWPIWIKRLKS